MRRLHTLLGPALGTLAAGSALTLAGAGWTASAPPVAPTPWPAELYNPKPLPDDLILPLPCGGALAFRPVATPADSPRTPLVGPFGGPAGRYLLIGKYEVSVLQYQAVMAQTCPRAGATTAAGTQVDPRVAAQVGVSRIDAVNFAAQLSRRLQATAADLPACAAGPAPCLPRVDGKPAFVRLPTDAEWEYAARGGAQVAPEVFRLSRYPMPEGLDRHAWYSGNAAGEIAPIGRRLPNPLGLHDLYGNAWELMNDPYRSAAFPGQSGGDVLMGGGIHSADEELRADARVEVQPYDSAGDVKTADTGFRVVLAAPVVTSTAKRPTPLATQAAAPASPATPAPAPALAPAPPAAGNLRVEVDAYALILVDGQVQGSFDVGLPLTLPGLRRGRHRIEASPLESGYAPAAVTVELGPDQPLLVPLHLEPTPERAEARLNLQADDRRRVRQQLNSLGYPCDPASDRFDRGFRVVLAEFQRLSKLPVTRYLTPETRALLERRAAARARAPDPSENAPVPRPGGRSLPFPERALQERWMDPDAP